MTVQAQDTAAAQNLAAMPVDSLIDHILARYHEIHRHELPALIALARKVERVHHDVPNARWVWLTRWKDWPSNSMST